MPLSRLLPVPSIHICGWVVRCSSVMMKDDICDKGTDHKLSNHSRNCLLAAPLVTLSTLPRVRVTHPRPPSNATAVLDALGQCSFWCPHKWVTSYLRALRTSLSRQCFWFWCDPTHVVNLRRQNKVYLYNRKTQQRKQRRVIDACKRWATYCTSASSLLFPSSVIRSATYLPLTSRRSSKVFGPFKKCWIIHTRSIWYCCRHSTSVITKKFFWVMFVKPARG